MNAQRLSLFSFGWARGGAVTSWRPALLWNEVYKGVEIGRLWVGWTNADYRRRGW